MLSNVANSCTETLLRKGIILESKKAVYIYGFELFFSTILTVLSMLIIGSYLKLLKESLIFLIFFMPIRMAAGGYHAKTYRACFLLTNMLFIAYLFSYIQLSEFLNQNTSMVCFAGFLIYICINSPIVNSKHLVSEQRKTQNRLWTYKIAISESLCVLILYFCNKEKMICAAMITTLLVVLMMIAARGEEKSNG